MFARITKTNYKAVVFGRQVCAKGFAILPEAISPQIKDPFFSTETHDQKKERMFHLSKLMSGVLTKKIDALTIEGNLLSKQKIIIEPIRERHQLDNFDFLRSNKEVPCVIQAREGHEPLDLVLHHQQVRALKRIRNFKTKPIYIRHQDQDIRCTIDRINISPDKQFYFKVYLNRYIVGQPNLITVELFMHPKFHSRLYGNTLEWIKHEVELISYNDVYPVRLELDFLRFIRNGEYTFGDLANLLPKGLELSPKYKNLSHVIVKLAEYQSKLEADLKHAIKMHTPKVDEVKITDDMVIDVEQMEGDLVLELVKKQRKAAMPVKPKKEFVTVKKQMQDEQERMKAQLQERLKGHGLQPSTPKKK